MSFLDETVIEISSGHGGAGAVSFRREKYVPRGGPDGGDGGRGGDVVFEVQANLKTLAHLAGRGSFHAEDGRPGEKRNRHGRDGKPVYIRVPPGTGVRDAETGQLLKDLTGEGTWTFLRGGKGGKGNGRFATSTNRAPRYAQPGLPGERAKVRVELSLIADVGLVGLPNAGKSTLISALTKAHPKTAAYPFTTKVPHLGVLKYGFDELVLADIPGIIDGASEGAGLGHRFLKHVSRTRTIACLVDLSGDNPAGDFRILEKELRLYDEHLLERKRIVVGTKTDLETSGEGLKAFKRNMPDERIVPVSAFTRDGLDDLIRTLFEVSQEVREHE